MMTTSTPTRNLRPSLATLAKVVTEVLAPAVVLVVLSFAVALHSIPELPKTLVAGLTAAIFVSIIPFAFILWGVRRGALTDHHVGSRVQRQLPLLVCVASSLAGLAALFALGVSRPLKAMVIAEALTLGIVLAISRWWKISVHAAIATGSVAILAVALSPWLWALTVLVLVLCWSRVHLRSHTPAQVVLGSLLGFLVMGQTFWVLVT